MKKKNSSAFGFILDELGISSAAMAREIHVDASLISKWKSGSRSLNNKSVYFDDVINFIFDESERDDCRTLKAVLSNFYPVDVLEDRRIMKEHLTDILEGKVSEVTGSVNNLFIDEAPSVKAQIFYGNEGKRNIVDSIIEKASQMTKPGTLIFIDSEEYAWLLEDIGYAKEFVEKLDKLLKRGYTAKFVIHFSSYKDRFVQFFETCNILLLQRNAQWYYYEYYDEDVFRLSFTILERAVCSIGIGSFQDEGCHVLIQDSEAVHKNRQMAENVISHCQPLFSIFNKEDFIEILGYVRQIKKKGTLYSYLPAPVFLSASPAILREILEDNNVEASLTEKCMIINNLIRKVIFSQILDCSNTTTKFVQIFQLEEMYRRVNAQPFLSCSLSIITKEDIKVTRKQYARCLSNIVKVIRHNENIEAVFFSEADNIPLPHYNEMNCWCKKNTWVIQMDKEGFRLSEEVSIVNAASITFERSLHKIPPERKSRAAVIEILEAFIEELNS